MTSHRPIELPPSRIAVENAATVRKRARRRIRLVGGLLGLCMVGIAAQGARLAAEPDARTLEIATSKRWTSVTTQGKRGTIVDKDGHVLARSVEHPAVFVDPEAVRLQAGSPHGAPVQEVASDLARLLELPEDEVLEILLGPGRYVRLARGVHPEVADIIRHGEARDHREIPLARRGVIVEENYRRFYPQGALAAQLLGFVDASGLGQQGIERYFNAELAGDELVSQHRVNRWGGLLDLLDGEEANRIVGHTVQLTVDRDIQRVTENALRRVMEQHAPISATAVVVEVATGRILAMATAPFFNPNQMDLLATPEDYKVTHNLAVASAVEPGSVFKPFTVAAALDAGVATLDTVLDTSSPWVTHGVRIRDDHPKPRMSVSDVIKYSSNIGAGKLAQAVGGDRLLATFEAFGLGEQPEIDTQGAVRGARRPRHHFGPVELATISYGQGATASTLQLAMATAALANDGVRMRPMLVDRIIDAEGVELRAWEPRAMQRVVSVETARAVVSAMERVTQEGGTGTRARVPGYRVAGKTGTAEKAKAGTYSAARYATFIGLAPADRPDMAMAIIVDEPTVGSRYGGVVAGPVFATVMAEALPLRGIVPDPALLTTPAPQPEPALADLEPRAPVEVVWQEEGWAMPDLTGRPMRDALAGLQGTGLRLDVQGSGLLVEQEPQPGRPVRPGQVVHLRFQ